MNLVHFIFLCNLFHSLFLTCTTVLDTVACLEAELVEYLQRTRNSNNRQSFSGTDAGHQQDTPDNIYTPSPIQPEKLQSFIQRLQDITSNRNQELETPDDRQAQVQKKLSMMLYICS